MPNRRLGAFSRRAARNGSGAPSWSPLNMAPAAWWRTSDYVVTGSGVSEWTDLSGNGRNLIQTTDASRPTVAADANFNNEPSITFDGVAHTLVGAADWLDPESNDVTVLFVAYKDPGTSTRYVYSKRTGTGDGYEIYTGSNLIGAVVDWGTTQTTTRSITFGVTSVWRYRMSVTDMRIQAFENGFGTAGTALTGPALPIDNANPVTIGAKSGASFWAGRLAEVVVLMRDMDSYLVGENVQFTNYVNARYGMAITGV